MKGANAITPTLMNAVDCCYQEVFRGFAALEIHPATQVNFVTAP